MPVDKRLEGRRGGALAAGVKSAPVSIPKFHLRVPDVTADHAPAAAAELSVRPGSSSGPADKQPVSPPASGNPKKGPTPPRDSIAEARAKLSEKRYADSHRQVTSMIEGLRDKRQRLFRRLWTASVVLTAISVVALAVELLQKTDILKSFVGSDSTEESPLMGKARKPRSAGDPKTLQAQGDSPQVWSNGLPIKIPTEVPAQAPVIEHVVSEKAVIEQIGHAERQGVWLPGTITENDSEGPARGDIHDDHQPRSR